GMTEPVGYCFSEALSVIQFFLYAFVDEYVGIYRHPDGQYDTGDPGKREYSAPCGQYAHQEEKIHQKGHVRHPTGAVIVKYHEPENNKKAHRRGNKPALDGFLTQGRADDGFFDDLRRSRHTAGFQHV